MGGVGVEVKIFTDITQDQVGASVAVEIGRCDGLPPSVEVAEVGMYFRKVVSLVGENTGRHPFSGDDQFFLPVAGDIGPYGAGHHANMGDIGIFCCGYIGEMSFAVINEQVAGGGDTVDLGEAPATDEKIRIAIVVKVFGNGHRDIHACIGEGVGIELEITFSIIFV